MKKTVGICPVCHKWLNVIKLKCSFCKTTVEGDFSFSKLGRLSWEDQRFVEIFIKCRGNIKKVEKKIGISYPTVCKRLEEIKRKI